MAGGVLPVVPEFQLTAEDVHILNSENWGVLGDSCLLWDSEASSPHTTLPQPSLPAPALERAGRAGVER